MRVKRKCKNINNRVFVLLFVCLFGSNLTVSSQEFIENTGIYIKKSDIQKQQRRIIALNISYDDRTGEVNYELAEEALVRVRVGFNDGGALLRNIIDWELRKKGKHTEHWDFRSVDGQVLFGARQDYTLTIFCLPPDSKPKKSGVQELIGFRKAPNFSITFPDHSGERKGKLRLLKGVVPIRVAINKQDQEWLEQSKFEMAMYIDNLFLFEDEEGSNPYTYQLNTAGLTKGVHIITVNIIGYQGEVGTHSLMVYVDKDN